MFHLPAKLVLLLVLHVIAPVSYTHLAVYKRQAMGIALDRFPMVSGIDQVKAIADPVVLLSVCLSADEKGIGLIG